MNMINRSNLRMLDTLIFTFALVGLLLVGCSPPPPPPTITSRISDITERCDGPFIAEVIVSQNNAGVTQNINIALGALVNINPGAAVNPAAFRLADGETKSVFVTGTLTNSCMNGSLNFTATGTSVIVSGAIAINIKAVPVKGTAPNGVTPNSNGVFTYNVTFNCCPGAAIAAHQITLSGSNVTNLAANPAAVNCPAAGAQIVNVTGKLVTLEREGKVFCLATGPAPAGGNCNLITNVEPAR